MGLAGKAGGAFMLGLVPRDTCPTYRLTEVMCSVRIHVINICNNRT